MEADVQLNVDVVAVAEATRLTVAAQSVYPAKGDVPGVNDHPEGADPNNPVDHVYVGDPDGAAGIVAAHWYTIGCADCTPFVPS